MEKYLTAPLPCVMKNFRCASTQNKYQHKSVDKQEVVGGKYYLETLGTNPTVTQMVKQSECRTRQFRRKETGRQGKHRTRQFG